MPGNSVSFMLCDGYIYTIAIKLSIFLCGPDFRSNKKYFEFYST